MKRSDASRVFGCASVLLSYPQGDFEEDLAAVGKAVESMPRSRAATQLGAVQRHLSSLGAHEAALLYVDTFDLRRRHSLYVTYYRKGDTRERGAALVSVAGLYQDAGIDLVPGELPDFLPAMLEFAAVSAEGVHALRSDRAALEALHRGLKKEGSVYAPAVSAVIAALGGISKSERIAADGIEIRGAPSERVGLEPFPLGEAVSRKVVIR